MKDTYRELPLHHFSRELQKTTKKKRLRCVIMGNFGVWNTGDEAILAGEIAELKKMPHVQIFVVSRFPHQIGRLHKVRAVSFYNFFAVLKSVREADIVVVGGGGLISRVERGVIGFMYQLYMLSLFFLLPFLLKKPTYVLGLGIYSNAHPFVLSLALAALRRVALLTVRDFHSQEFLQWKGIKSKLVKDSSFLMPVLPADTVLKEQYMRKYYSKERHNIGLSLCYPTSVSAKKKLLQELAAFIITNQKRADFWFYPLDSHPGYANDEQFAQEVVALVKKQTKANIRFHILPKAWQPQQMFSTMKLMDFVITMRLHGAIFAYRLHKPFLGIYYDLKGESFLASIGKKPFSVRDITAEVLQKEVEVL